MTEVTKTNTSVDVSENMSQFRGHSNPYDILWYISVELGRSFLFRAKRVGTGIGDGAEGLLEKHAEICEKLSKLTDEEREFLLKDSYFGKTDFYEKENKQLMELAKRSKSEMSTSANFSSKKYLIATMGEEAGTKEFNRHEEIKRVAKLIGSSAEAFKILDKSKNEQEKYFKDLCGKTFTVEDILEMEAVLTEIEDKN